MTEAPEMKVKALAPWFGSKRTMAPLIVRQLGKHVQFFEPFVGGFCVVLSKPPCRQETVNDLHGNVINLAWVLQDDALGPKLCRRLRRTIVSDEFLSEARARIGEYPDECERPDSDRAFWFFIVSWMGRKGECGLADSERGSMLCVRWTANGGDSAVSYWSAVNSIPAFRARLRRVVVLRRDAFDVIGKIPDVEGCAVYCDPPYIEKSDRYKHDFGGGFMGQADDHQRMRDAVSRFKKTRVVVSYYDHERVRELYEGWTFIDCARGKNLHSAGGRGERSTQAPEVLIVNGAAY